MPGDVATTVAIKIVMIAKKSRSTRFLSLSLSMFVILFFFFRNPCKVIRLNIWFHLNIFYIWTVFFLQTRSHGLWCILHHYKIFVWNLFCIFGHIGASISMIDSISMSVICIHHPLKRKWTKVIRLISLDVVRKKTQICCFKSKMSSKK